MSFNIMKRQTLSALLALAALSCSIKEERDECPCLLSIFPDGSLEQGMYKSISNSFLISDAGSGQQFFQGSLAGDSFAGGNPYKIKLPKSSVNVHSIFGVKNMKGNGSVLRIGEGSQADSVFVYSGLVDCTGETASDTLQLAKQWCSMRISFKQSESWQVDECSLKGEWDGFDTGTLLATKGSFNFDAEKIKENSYIARLPRQGDDSLVLTIEYDNDDRKFTRQYPIGEYIAEARYDWNKRELDDLVVFIDRAEVRVVVVVPSWDNGKDYGELEI